MLTRELYAYYMHNSNVSSNYVRLFVNHLCERKHQRVLKGLVRFANQFLTFWLFDCNRVWAGYKGQPTDS
jgi:hypothetical protein